MSWSYYFQNAIENIIKFWYNKENTYNSRMGKQIQVIVNYNTILDEYDLVIFRLRRSDIFANAKVILKPDGFSNIIFAIKLCEAQYNSTLGEYNCEAI